ncbi:rhodanese-like domain-containing protein [Aquimarina sp. RZ0]|uniref:rhodanese-like domain-containing protein n=1 Tax=Aquimarina sp. RZ0 TaxID=2607730 RepID=UPI0011F30CF1|nr:rhodanese-like domain-containing protein [Aquimarina sp. RZ0]KAA1244104.1 rhodanese-like domain-containing protein [Aquimarina sp. RZ0]
MKKTTILILSLILPLWGVAQDSLDELLDTYNDESIPYISVKELIDNIDKVILLDAREKEEFQVSHLKNAIYIGYNNFSTKLLRKQKLPTDTPIVVYCSLGIRSEDIAKNLKKEGYQNVRNLYGGIFEWRNKDQPIVDSDEKLTDKIHAFSKEWGKWLHKGTKIYTQ